MRRTRPVPSRTQEAGSNYKNLPWHEIEPAGHGIGRSRGGLTTKIHQAVDGRGRPLAMVVTGGQRNDGAMLAHVLAEIHVPRLGSGRARTRPDAVIADRAYTSGVTRTELRRRGIRAVIPEKSDQIAARKRRGSRGGRPPRLDEDAYRGRNVVERSFALAKQWRGLATRYDKLAIIYRAAVTISAILTWLRHMGDTPYLRSMKQDDSYQFSYDYEYVADRFGDGDDDVKLENARLNVSLSWDDSSAPGYVVSYTVDSPTPIPNDWTGDADQIFSDLWLAVTADLSSLGIGSELHKDWPI